MPGQIFPCSLGERSEAGVGSADAIFLSFWGTRVHVRMCSPARLLFQPPSFSLFSHTSENLHLFLKPVLCRSPKTRVSSGPWGHSEAWLTISRPCSWPRTPAQLRPGPPVPAPGLLQGYPVPFPAVPDSSSGSPRLTSDLTCCLAVARLLSWDRTGHHPLLCSPRPDAGGRHPAAAVPGVTATVPCWGRCRLLVPVARRAAPLPPLLSTLVSNMHPGPAAWTASSPPRQHRNALIAVRGSHLMTRLLLVSCTLKLLRCQKVLLPHQIFRNSTEKFGSHLLHSGCRLDLCFQDVPCLKWNFIL